MVSTELVGRQVGGQATMATHPKNTKEKKRKEKTLSYACPKFLVSCGLKLGISNVNSLNI